MSQNAELDCAEFASARKAFRRQLDSSAALQGQERDTNALYSAGPEEFFAVFEESGYEGWFYLYAAMQRKILKAAQIYNCADVAVDCDVVDIGWAADDSACGLALWGEFRAFLGISSDLQISKPMKNADEEGIPSSEWPTGFEHYLEPKID